jgi:hypothetical protein
MLLAESAPARDQGMEAVTFVWGAVALAYAGTCMVWKRRSSGPSAFASARAAALCAVSFTIITILD